MITSHHSHRETSYPSSSAQDKSFKGDFTNCISTVACLYGIDLKALQTSFYSLLLLDEFVFANYMPKIKDEAKYEENAPFTQIGAHLPFDL